MGVVYDKMYSFKASDALIEQLDQLVKRGFYASRSEAIRAAIRDLIKKHRWMQEMMEAE